MSLVSMTGFADGHGAHEGLRWRWEAKSVNGRGLDCVSGCRPALMESSPRPAHWRQSGSDGVISRQP